MLLGNWFDGLEEKPYAGHGIRVLIELLPLSIAEAHLSIICICSFQLTVSYEVPQILVPVASVSFLTLILDVVALLQAGVTQITYSEQT